MRHFHLRAFCLLASGLLAVTCSREPAKRAARDTPAAAEPLVAASVGSGGPDAFVGLGGFDGPGGFGGVRGQLVPAGVEAAIQVTAAGADTQAIGPTFSDPLSGAFTADELPVGVYRVVVAPLDPAYLPRVFEGVVVSHDGVRDLGTVDLRRDSADTQPRKGGRGEGEAR